jgi:predicted HicB family RNase H-like nuclease
MKNQTRTTVRMTRDLKEKLTVIADSNGWSFNKAVIESIKLMIEKDDLPF